jgi:NAD(P)-dependent dehydrogenase (short-subunit alcohol dehydrogenase family)
MKQYLIIGGSSGIGLALAEELSKSNQVFATFAKNEQSSSTNLQYHFIDVLEENLDFSFLPEKIDGLVYCPGAINLKPFARIKPSDFLQDYQLQVVGAVKVIQAVLPKLKLSEHPAIVLFSTVAVQTGFNFHSLVSSSKGAIEGLTKALAAEFSPKIRINCIAPSITDTPLAGTILSTPEKKEANAQRHPLKKIGSAQDIANLASFLLTEQSSWITGQILHIDGGISSLKI